MLTKPQRKALQILRDHGPIQPREFAKKMWPDSPCWRHHIKCGPSGSHRGGGMYLAAGGYLGKLGRRGWAKPKYKFLYWDKFSTNIGHILTDAGRAALEAD